MKVKEVLQEVWYAVKVLFGIPIFACAFYPAVLYKMLRMKRRQRRYHRSGFSYPPKGKKWYQA